MPRIQHLCVFCLQGGILKVKSGVGRHSTPKSAPPKMQGSRLEQNQHQAKQAPGSASKVTPKSVPRAKASLFF